MIANSTKLSFILGWCLIQKIDHWNMENILLTALNSLSGSGATFSIFTMETLDYRQTIIKIKMPLDMHIILEFIFIWEFVFWSWIFDRKLYHLWYDWVHYHVSFAVLMQSIHKGNCIATGEVCSYSWQQKDLRICFAVGCFPIYWFVVFHCLRLRFQVTRSSW